MGGTIELSGVNSLSGRTPTSVGYTMATGHLDVAFTVVVVQEIVAGTNRIPEKVRARITPCRRLLQPSACIQ